MKVIAVFNQKGGVGKTSTVANLMAEFTKRGKVVLGIDIDPQSHLTKFLGASERAEATIGELLSGEQTFMDVAENTPYGDLIPSDRSLATRLNEYASRDAGFMFRMREIVTEVTDTYDLCLIDCPPSVNQLTVAALIAADYVLIPTEAEYFSLDGVCEIEKTIRQVQDNKYLNPTLKVLGVFFTRYRANLSLTRDMHAAMEKIAAERLGTRLMKSNIPQTCDVPESQAARRAIADYRPASKAAAAYAKLTDELEAVI